jgi:hypothetical protein
VATEGHESKRNLILVAAGYAPVFEERPLASPEMAAARQAVERVLKGHEPFPALAVDRHWQLVSSNPAVAPKIRIPTCENPIARQAGGDPIFPVLLVRTNAEALR